MVTISADEARAQLDDLLDRVAQGEQITISREGRPVAVLSRAQSVTPEQTREAVEKLLEFRKHHTFEGSIRDAIDEGRA